jgi:hypothetical protein
MSIALIKSILEGQDVKTNNLSIGFEFNRKFLYFSVIRKLIEMNQGKRILILNFDILFHKYIMISDLKNTIKTYNTVNNIGKENITMFNLYLHDLTKETYQNIFNSMKSVNLIITTGVDLLSDIHIHNFFKINKSNILASQFNFFFSALDDSFINLGDDIELKRDIIRSKLGLLITEKTSKVSNNKLLVYSEFTNISKLTKDIGILEYNTDTNSNLPVNNNRFEKLNVYLKEYKDIFELPSEDNITVEPMSTFKLTLNEKELQAKNEVILPYMNNKEKATITIDQDDLNELYEEDPDGDLDI